MHRIEKSVDDVEDRLWDLEEHLMGERLEDGKIYVKRRVDKTRVTTTQQDDDFSD